MVDKFFSFFFGTKHERDVRHMLPIVKKINSFEPSIKQLSDIELRGKIDEFRLRYKTGESLDKMLPEVFAVVREGSWRTLGLRHFDVQMMGGIVLHQGKISEMKTGEGKTLVATLAVVLNAISGDGVHVVTVNDYLARRDAEWMKPIYNFLGLTVGAIQHDMDPDQRQSEYACDITYGTNNEFGFDYLRDNMVEHISLKVQRKLNYAIVDEVDSILIDEARTPLIISGSADDSTKKYYIVDKIIPSLKAVEDYDLNEKDHNVILTEAGVHHVEKLLKIDNLYDNNNIDLVHHVNQALKAHTLFSKDVDYIVKDGQVVIVDEFTGRLMDGRRYSDGLHQALEAKENLTVARESQTLASITFQNYFRMYNKLAGMTGTADTEAMEFKKIYNLDVVVIPTNQGVARKDHSDLIYRTEREKFNAIANEILEKRKIGQPVLVGTISIEKSEHLSNLLKAKGIPHNVLNAKFHQKEAEIVAEAGSPGAVTIATNMAGRGTDIVLGGRRLYKEHLDQYTPVHDKDLWNKFRGYILSSNFDEAERMLPSLTGKDESHASQIVREAHEWVTCHDKVVAAGGLHILGTERHESRRIDNQLRGRSGRQGDPGSSRFYLSLEDDLMRIFGSDRISGVMGRLGMEEGQEIESSMVTKAIANAQKRVEGRNFDIRKHLLEYDDVMNAQRKFIYEERNGLLEGDDISSKINEYIDEVVESSIIAFSNDSRHPEDWNVEGLKTAFKTNFNVDVDLEKVNPYNLSYEEFVEGMITEVKEKYLQKSKSIGDKDMRVLERIIALQVIDTKWREHLYSMDELRDGIWTISYGERNPLIEYKRRGYGLFKDFLYAIKVNIVEFILKVQVRQVVENERPTHMRYPIGQEQHQEVGQFANSGGFPVGVTPVQAAPGSSEKAQRKAATPTVGGVTRKSTRRR